MVRTGILNPQINSLLSYAVFNTSTLAIGSGASAGRATSTPSAVRVTFNGLWDESARR